MNSISVIIPTFNRRTLLRRTLDALKPQNVSVPFEVIVSDDCSTDGTADMLDAARYPFNLTILRSPENQGRAAARNRGLEAATGDLIVFLDDDMVTVPLFLAAHLALHQQTADAVVQGNILCDPSGGLTAFDRYWDHTGVHRLGPGEPIPFKYFATGNASAPRSLLEKTGPFDEEFKAYGGEDIELAFRLSRLPRARFVYAADAVSYHLDLKPFTEVLPRIYRYGRTSLHYIYSAYPDMARALKLEVIQPFSDGDTADLRRLKRLHRLLYRPLVAWLCRRIALPLLPGPLRYPVFDYLISYHYLKGLRERLAEG